MLTALTLKHILRRTSAILTTLNSNNSTTPRPRTADGRSQRDDDKSQSGGDEQRATSPGPHFDTASRIDANDATAHDRDRESRKEIKKGVKAVAFLSRLMGGTKKKDALEDDTPEDEDTASDDRPEGNDAEVFTQKMDNMGFSPRHPQPPAYIKVRAKYKQEKDFDRLFLAQELSCNQKSNISRQSSSNKLRRKHNPTIPDASQTIWAMEFSRDGKYLAAAGADKIVRIWAVLASPEDRQKHERQEALESEGDAAHAEHLSAPVFQSKPIQEYEGHSSTVLDLSWSKNNFLLSSSMDKTVRLWHVSRSGCLCTFKHNDFVPSIAFHPKDDRFFLAGSLDCKLRLWSIPDKNVAFAAQVPDMITAVAFTPDGKSAMAGCLSGLCMFFETEGLRYQTQIHVRSTRGQNAKGSKITGITAFNTPAAGDTKVLITSNDSRIRLYNWRDKSLELKFRGNQNNCSQIRASLSDDGRYIACGSEDKKAYIWSLEHPYGEKRDKTPLEIFDAHNSIATAVCVAPTKTRQNLSRSEDPVYDICNPPPITLLSHAERSGADSVHSSSQPQSVTGSVVHTPPDFERPKESPQYLAKTGHKGGNILVTADFSGRIKVFRQDCAWSKRQRDDDRASLFSKRGTKPGVARSLASKPSLTSLREPRRSTSTLAGSDRILSWQQGLSSTSNVAAAARSASKSYPPVRSSTKASNRSRSNSPKKSTESRRGRTMPGASDKATSVNSTQPPLPSSHPLAAGVMVRSPSPINRAPMNGSTDHRNGNDPPHNSSAPTSPRYNSSTKDDNNALNLDPAGRSYMFWDKQLWQEHANRINDLHKSQDQLAASGAYRSGSRDDGDSDGAGTMLLRPPLKQQNSHGTVVSQLSDELTDESGSETYEDAREEDEEERCPKCGGTSFSAKKKGKEGMRLVCTTCGHDV